MRNNEHKLWLGVGSILIIFLVQISAAENEIAPSMDCYYNYNHYSEGDRILTNEPCLNCTCHNRMLMCYLKVCPFTKPIGQDCKIEKREDQCCPVITCPEVTVELDHSVSSQTALAKQHQGCTIDSKFYAEGTQVPGNPKKPCEICYCIRNMTSCVMQECTLHVDGCRPIYNKGVCCPVRYDCAYGDDVLQLEDLTTTTAASTTTESSSTTTTTEAYSQGFVITTTSSPSQPTDCAHNGTAYADGELVITEQPCEHCYCMRGDIVCAVQECGTPLDMEGKNCTARPPREGECCPDVYDCEVKADEPQLIADKLPKTESEATVAPAAADSDAAAVTTVLPAIAFDDAEPAASTPSVDDSENEIHDKDDSTEKPIIRESTERAEEATTVLYEEELATVAPAGSLGSRLSEGQTETPLSPEDDEALALATTIAAEHGEEDLGALSIDQKVPQEDRQPIQDLPEATTFAAAGQPSTTLPPSVPEDESVLLANIIPGEGDCLLDGISYANSSAIAPRNKCEISCQCLNSIVQCENVRCASVPENAWKCKVSRNEDECCLSYECEDFPTTEGQREVITAGPIITSRPDSLAVEEGSGQFTTQSAPKVQDEVTNEAVAELGTTQWPERVESSPHAAVPNLPLDEVYTQGPIESDSHRTEVPAIEPAATEAASIAATPATEAAATATPIAPERQATITPAAPQQEATEAAFTESSAQTKLPKETESPASVEEKDQAPSQAPAEAVGTTTFASIASSTAEPEASTQVPSNVDRRPIVSEHHAPEIVTEGFEAGTTIVPLPFDQSKIQSSIDDIIKQTAFEGIPQEIFTEPQQEATTEDVASDIALTTLKPTDEALELDNRIDETTAAQTEQAPIQKVEPIASSTEVQRDVTAQRVEEQPTIIEAVSVTQQPSVEGSTDAVITVTPSGVLDEDANKKAEESTDSTAATDGQTTPQQVSIVLPESVQQPDILDLIKQTIEQELVSATFIPFVEFETETPAPIAPQIAAIPQTTIAPIPPKVENIPATESPIAEQKPSAPIVPSIQGASIEEQQSEEISAPESGTTSAPLTPLAEDAAVSATTLSEGIDSVATTQQSIPPSSDIQSVVKTTEQPEQSTQRLAEATEQAELATTISESIPIVAEKVTPSSTKLPAQELPTTLAEEIESSTPQLLAEPEQPAIISSEPSRQPALVDEALLPTTISNESVESPTTVSQIIPQVVPIGTRIKPSAAEPIASTEFNVLPTEKPGLELTVGPVSEEDEASTEVDDSKLAKGTESIKPEEATTSAAGADLSVEITTAGLADLEQSKRPQQSQTPHHPTQIMEQPILVQQQEPAMSTVQSPSIEQQTIIAEALTTESPTTDIQEPSTAQPIYKLPSESVVPLETVATTQEPISAEVESNTEQKFAVVPEQEAAATQQPIIPTQTVAEEIPPSTSQDAEESSTQPEAARPVQAVLNQEKQPALFDESITTERPIKTAEPGIKQTTEGVQDISTNTPSIVRITEAAPFEELTETAYTTAAPAIPAIVDKLPSIQKIEPAVTTVQSAEVEEEQTSSPATEGAVSAEFKPSPSIATEQPQGELESSTSQFEQQTSENIASEVVTTAAPVAPAEDLTVAPSTALPISKTNLTVALDDGLGEVSTPSAQLDELTTESVTDRDLSSSQAPEIAASSTAAPATEAATETSSQSPFKPDLIHSSEEEEEEERPTTLIVGPEFRPQSTVDLMNLLTGSIITEPAIFDAVPTRLPPTTIAPADENPTTVRQSLSSEEAEEEEEEEGGTAAVTEHAASITEIPTTERVQLVEQEPQNETIYEPVQTIAPHAVAPSKIDASALDERFDASTDGSVAAATNAPQLPTQRPASLSVSTTLKPEEIPAILHNKTEPIVESTRFNQTGAAPTSSPALLSSFASSSTTLSTPKSTQAAPTKKPSYQAPPSYDSYGQVSSEYPGATYTDDEYTDEEEPTVFGPGTCRYGGKLYVSAQQIPRDDPCDFCFCFRSDIICLQQSCPPPISGCHEEPIQGFCCPRYECPVSMALVYNASTSTTTTTTLPPHLVHYAINNTVSKQGCQIQGTTYQKGEAVSVASGPCIDCICGGDGQMKCEPKICTPEPMLQQMIAIAASRR